ncbi:MAG: tRNA (guanosine(37)-N1)-methyltransferase TrmD [Deltaproteobacteria bacterium]|nr:tRNA (guanosine(37)-N1)-methyltransferase TrmD [Deltaproteobacteria bacterium]
MRFEILTLFPELLQEPLQGSILGRAETAGHVRYDFRNIRDHAEGKHRIVDDSPYGGGAGMVMKPEPLVAAIEAARGGGESAAGQRVVLLGPAGAPFTQEKARELATLEHLILVCGRYEGVDERVRSFIDEEISVGDFVLSGGEPAAWVVVDAVTRLLPGVLGNAESAEAESFEDGCLEHPHYTRPPVFRGLEVPEVLKSGDHAKIARYRRIASLQRTRARRPDLFARLQLDPKEAALLAAEGPGEEGEGE